jgi:hypothetical protein
MGANSCFEGTCSEISPAITLDADEPGPRGRLRGGRRRGRSRPTSGTSSSSTPGSRGAASVIPTNEELVIAREVRDTLGF